MVERTCPKCKKPVFSADTRNDWDCPHCGALIPREPEYKQFRCCMCPNSDAPESTQCPSGSPCRFVKTYIDERGWKYKVMGGLGKSNYKARYQKPGKSGWKCMTRMEWRKSFDEAQRDLNILAKEKGWKEL